MTCRELAALVAEHGEEALGPEQREHLRECRECEVYVTSIRVTVRSLAALPPQPAEPERRERLLVLFRAERG